MVVDALFPDIFGTSSGMVIGNNMPPIREYELVATFGILTLWVWNVPPERNPGDSQPTFGSYPHAILYFCPNLDSYWRNHTIDQGRGILFIKDVGWN